MVEWTVRIGATWTVGVDTLGVVQVALENFRVGWLGAGEIVEGTVRVGTISLGTVGVITVVVGHIGVEPLRAGILVVVTLHFKECLRTLSK